VRAGRRGLLAGLQLAAEVLCLLLGHGGAESRPDVVLLVVDVLAAGAGELGEELLELRGAGVELVELVEHLLALVLLADRGVGQLVTVGQVLAHGGPEVHLLDGLVLGLLDDELLRELLALGQLLPGDLALPYGAQLKLGKHLLHLGVVPGQDFECVRHVLVLLSIPGRARSPDCTGSAPYPRSAH
jgi:hypothetical protein